MNAIGDLARFLSSTRFQSQLQQRMDTSGQALSTGIVVDKGRHVAGDTMTLSLLDRKVALLEQRKTNLAEAQLFTGSAQSTLGKIQTTIEDFANRVPIVSQSATPSQIELVSQAASTAFVDVIDALNVRVGNRYVFSGAATDQKPLPSGNDVLERLVADLHALPIGADIELAIEDWFNDAAGPYMSALFTGSDQNPVSLPVGPTQTTPFALNASSDVMKDALGAFAKSIAVQTLGDRLSKTEQVDLLLTSKTNADAAVDDVVKARGMVGFLEERIGVSQTENAAALDQQNLDKANLVAADEFLEISRFEDAQQRLEILYRLAARQGQTSLAEYLR